MAIDLKAILIGQPTETMGALEDSKVKVIEVADCLQGIRGIIRHRPDFVLCRVELEGLNGLSMARILLMLKINIPLIMTAPEHKPAHEKIVENLPNVVGYWAEAGIYYDLKRFVEKFKRPSSNKRDKPQTPYSFKFIEHEWANLLEKSNKKRILLIEKDELTRKAILTKLNKIPGLQLFTCQDGLEGLLKALFIKPNLILTEIDIPEINGLALAQILYVLGKPIPLVFVTANEQKEVKRKATNIEGVVGFLHKSRLPRRGFLAMALAQYLQKSERLQSAIGESYEKARVDNLETEKDSII
ncbi:MAG: response regulator [SAR324 cluster bacterium]|nr:response regulator [SAR324 cluster bacterium]